MKVYWKQNEIEIKKSAVYPAPYLEHKTVDFVTINESGGGELAVEFDVEPQSVCVRPKSLGLAAEINGKIVKVKPDKPCNFSLEINGSTDNALLVFISGEDKTEKQDYENIIYFKKGVQTAGIIKIEHDSTMVYFEEGAQVSGKIYAEGRKHIAVSGTGVLTMENYERGSEWELTLDLRHCSDVIIENITVTDSCGWSCRIFGCDDVHIYNLKIIGSRGNSDGIDVCGSRNVLVENCFTRVWDDSLVAKAFNTGNLENIIYRNCTLWNDFARPIEVGVELRAEKVRNIRFENIDIIHSPTGYPLMGIHHGDRAEVSDIAFENIRVEDTPAAQLFDIRITDSVWNTDDTKGGISNISFKNIDIVEKLKLTMSKSRLQGFDEKARIKNVTFENIRINGCAARNPQELGLDIMDYVENVRFAEADSPYIELVKSTVEIDEFKPCCGMYNGKVKVTLENTTAQTQNVNCSLLITPSFRAEYDNNEINVTLGGHEKYEQVYNVSVPAGKYCIRTESQSPNVSADWKFAEFELMLEDDIEKAQELTFVNCRGEKAGSVKLALKDDMLIVKSDLLKNSGITVYAAKPVPTAPNQVVFSVEETDCAMSPALINGRHGLELAPQLRCPAEITYVFKNEPAVEKILMKELCNKVNGISYISLELLGIDKNADSFWLELEAHTDIKKRYPFCMFGSQVPGEICHMFATVKRK